MKNIKRNISRLILLIGITLFFLVAVSYTVWNRSDPAYTCVRCHEIDASHKTWLASSHAEVHCTECHGTALSDGFHSLKEKKNMLFRHIAGKIHHDDIQLSEAQVLTISDRCAGCHRAEYAGWLASGHAVNYVEIFEDSVHNAMEKPYWDCLRCHGMFYDGNIHDLMTLDSEYASDWKIRDRKQVATPTIPCLACHQMHIANPVSQRYVSMRDSLSVSELRSHPKTAWYLRADKIYLPTDLLTPVQMMDAEGNPITSATDPGTLLCQQCHSPDYKHRVMSEDDRTVTGVHEGISCIACHRPHAGKARQSCTLCHSTLADEEIRKVFDHPHTYSVNKKPNYK